MPENFSDQDLTVGWVVFPLDEGMKPIRPGLTNSVDRVPRTLDSKVK